MKIKKGDQVLIITGKDKGEEGKVIKAMPGENKVVVEGLHLRKKHVKPKKKGESGQVVEFPAPMDVSNVKLICPSCGEPTRVGYKVEKGNKVRICKKCDQEI